GPQRPNRPSPPSWFSANTQTLISHSPVPFLSLSAALTLLRVSVCGEILYCRTPSYLQREGI
uniref:Uncharacterized protein n=1 Tax=Aegilops tauschii subsp. strangulata TaxID=200361 RepID=A0A453KAC4_AEGTS